MNFKAIRKYGLKKTVLWLFLLGAFCTVNGQIITEHGIMVQGIVRGKDNVPVVDKNVTLELSIVEMVKDDKTDKLKVGETLFAASSVSVATDTFGVFAKVIGVASIDAALFGRLAYQAYSDVRIRVVYDGTEVMNSKITPVPYAAVAYNGVMVGTVLPYMGSTAPVGYLLCNGADIPSAPIYDELKNLLKKTTTPNLSGMFLSGAGSSPKKPHLVPAGLGMVQNEQLARHNHKVAITSSQSSSIQINYRYPENYTVTGGMPQLQLAFHGFAAIEKDPNGVNNQSYTTRGNNNEPVFYSLSKEVESTPLTELVIKHKHFVGGKDGHTQDNIVEGPGEIRPYSYGVNYIIKY